MVAHYWKHPVSSTLDLSTKTHAILNFSTNIIIKYHIKLPLCECIHLLKIVTSVCHFLKSQTFKNFMRKPAT